MIGTKRIAWLAVGGLAAAAIAAITLQPAPDEALTAPQTGTISGVITPAGQVASLTLVSRQTGVTAESAEFDATTGQFSFADLPGDAAYDIVIATADGKSVEGIDLAFTDARLLRLAARRRELLGVPAEEDRAFVQRDVDAILRYIKELEDFMDLKRPLYIAGHGRRATVLIEAMRARDYHQSDGNVVWRMELWYFEYRGGWLRVGDASKLLRRVRAPAAKWGEIEVEYWPSLSVFVNADGTSDPVSFQLAVATDPSRGRPAGSEPLLETEPHVLGVTEVTDDDAPLDLNAPR